MALVDGEYTLYAHAVVCKHMGSIQCTENLIYVFPEMKLRGPHSQFLQSRICERFKYSQDQSAYLAAAK
jgi:hypothetical protein